jgi:hypothetical protein
MIAAKSRSMFLSLPGRSLGRLGGMRKVIESARKKADAKLGRYGGRMIKTLPDAGTKRFIFNPPASWWYGALIPAAAA